MSNIFTLAIAAEITGGGWAAQYFTAIRKYSIAHAGTISSIAIALACIFIAFKFIKMYYDLVSDEQAGGFGGVRMWDILRPLTILILVMTFGTWLSWLDGICNSVSSALTMNINQIAVSSQENLESKLSEYQTEINKSNKELINEATEEAKQVYGDGRQKFETLAKNILQREGGDINNGVHSITLRYGQDGNADGIEYYYPGNMQQASLSFEQLGLTNQDEIKELVQNGQIANQYYEQRDEFIASKLQFKRFARWIQKGGSVLGTIVTWFFNIIFVVMMAFADVMLCLLAMFGPLAAAISILDPWKQSLSTWIGHYIEISLWKPIGSAICWIIVSVKAAVGNLGITQALGLSQEAGKSTILAAVGAQCLIILAGIMAMAKVPSLTNTILSLGKMDDGYAGTAGRTMTGNGIVGKKLENKILSAKKSGKSTNKS